MRPPPALVAAIAIALAACKQGPVNDVPDARESPQAKAEPAPLATTAAPTSSVSPLGLDAGPPPVPLRADLGVPGDVPPKDYVTGYELEGWLRPIDPPPAFRGKETSIEAIDAAKRKNEPRFVIDLAPGRARVALASGAFVLPEDTELRARADRYGHFLLLPNANQYRVAAPGSLRALFDDRRLDVEPLAPADVTQRGEGSRRLSYRTRRVEVTNRAGTATFEVARVPEASDGGVLVCRVLLELMNAPPSTPVCALDDVPLHVEWRWSANRQGLVFDATSIAHRTDLAASTLAAPPSSASFAPPSIPALGAVALVAPNELAAFRNAPADLPPSSLPDGAPPPPDAGLALANPTDQLRFAWLDGAPVAWVAPGGRVALPSLLRGRYGFAWRSFLADMVDAPITINVPDVEIAGASDAGAP